MPRDGAEIGVAEKPVRKRANASTKSRGRSPASNIQIGQTKPERRASGPTCPETGSPSAPIPEIAPKATKVRRKGANMSAKPTRAAPPSATITQIASLQKIRKFCIKSQSRANRSMESLIASTIGFRLDGDEADIKAIFKQAKRIREAVEKGDADKIRVEYSGNPILLSFLPLILPNAQSRVIWDDERKRAERQMEVLVKSLPIWSWAVGVRGLGLVSLGVIIGEAGIPIGEYRTISGLWKRMGLAVINGQRQRKVSGAGALEQGYSPTRRAEIWAMCSDTMFRAQWRGDRDENGGDPKKSGLPVATAAHPIGPYGEVYAKRRLQTAARMEATADLPLTDPEKWSGGRCRNDARRIMTKALLADLWIEWRRLSPAVTDA